MTGNEFLAIISGLSLGMTSAEYNAYERGELVFKTKYENKRLIREIGGTLDNNIPDFPWDR